MSYFRLNRFQLKTSFLIGLWLIAFLAKGYAQEELLKELSYPNSQLTFSGMYLGYDKSQIRRQHPDALYSKYTPSGQFKFGYHHALMQGYGVNTGLGFNIKTYHVGMSLRDPDVEGPIPIGSVSSDNLIFVFPISIDKLFQIRDKGNFLLIEGGLIANAQLFKEAGGGVGADWNLNDSVGYTVLDVSHTTTANRWLLSGFAKIGLQHMTKELNTISVSLIGNYGGLNYARGNYWLIDQGIRHTGTYSSNLNYLGLELSYGFGLKPNVAEQKMGVYEKPKRPKFSKSLWFGASVGVMNPQERIKDQYSFYKQSPYLYGKATFFLEWNSKLNYKLNYSFNELSIEMCYNPKRFGYGSSSSFSFGSYIHSMDVLFGKTAMKTRQEDIRVKPWFGIGVNYMSGAPKKNAVLGSGTLQAGDSGNVTFKDTSVTYLSNPLVPRFTGAIEFEVRFLRHLYFSFVPSYSLSWMQLYRSNLTYSTQTIKDAKAEISSNYSQWNLQFGLKVPLYRLRTDQ